MEIRPDPENDVCFIDGVKFTGHVLRQMTQPDPDRLLSFHRDGDEVKVTNHTHRVTADRARLAEVDEVLRVSAAKVEELTALRDQFERRYIGQRDNLEKAQGRIKALEKQVK